MKNKKSFITLTDDELRNFQFTQVTILKEIDRICKKHNINFFLYFGTLLGAIRHQGFIPWDDDIDIGMFRYDYDNFINACKTDLGNDYFLQTIDTDPGYGNTQGRILLNNTLLVTEHSKYTKSKTGVSVSIFVFYCLPKNPFIQKIHIYFTRLLIRAYKLKKKYSFPAPNSLLKVLFLLFAGFISIFPSLLIKKLLYHYMLKYNKSKKTDDLNVICCELEFRTVCKLKDITQLKLSKFEDENYSIPVNYDKLLKNIYGNYMELPPIEQRTAKHKMLEYKNI
jgi:lipopolysaccharide cholinephosphotransferase